MNIFRAWAYHKKTSKIFREIDRFDNEYFIHKILAGNREPILYGGGGEQATWAIFA